MNRKGAEKILGVYWFLVLGIVAGAIVFMVLSFYGSPYDVRDIESTILVNNVANCLSKNGQLEYKINEELENNFLEICNFNFKTNDEQGQYYVKLEFLDFNTDEKLKEISIGNINLRNNPSNSLFLSTKSFHVLDETQEVIVKINSVINKEKKNVR